MPGTRSFFIACAFLSLILFVASLGGTLQPREVSAEVAAGLEVWRGIGCEGCHTLYGQGGNYAPDLTHIYTQRGADYIREFLVNPSAFHPGQRAMPRFLLTRSDEANLLAFLQWVAVQTDWPPRPIQVNGQGLANLGQDSAPALENSTDPVVRGQILFSRAPANCATCHLLEPDAVRIGPSLAGIATRAASRVPGQSAEDYLRTSIINPSAYIVAGFPDAMQKNLGTALSSQQINDLIAFLVTLDTP